MIENKLFHNPNCSKSICALNVIENTNFKIKIVNYIETPPTIQELEFICTFLNIEPIDIIRTSMDEFKKIKIEKTTKKDWSFWFNIIVSNPIILERPILIYNNKVAIGRPLKNIETILNI